MKKRINVFFIFILLFQTMASGILAPSQIKAEGSKESVFTDLYITDHEKNPIVIEDLKEDSTVLVNIDWSIQNVAVEAGSTYSMKLDAPLEMIDQQDGSLTIEEADETIKIGTYDISLDGTVAAIFDEEIEEYPDASDTIVAEAFVAGANGAEEVEEPSGEEIDSEDHEQTNEDPVDSDVTEDHASDQSSNLVDSDEETDENATENNEEDADDQNSEETDEKKDGKTIVEENSSKEPTKKIKQTNEEKYGFNLEIGEVTDLDGNPFSAENLLDPKDEFQLKLNWNLKDDHNYKNGDTVTFDLPKGIKIQEDIKVELKDGKQTVANAVITPDKKVELTFTEFVETHSNVKGWMEIISTLDEKEVEVEDGEAVIEPIGEEDEIRIPIDLGKQEKTIEKKGTPNKGYNADEINWEVIINKNKTSLKNVKVTDVLPEGTEYKEGSLTVTKLKVSLDGNILEDLEEVNVTPEVNEDGELIIPLGDTEDAYRVEYVTNVIDDEEKKFRNEAILKDDKLDDVKANASVTINRGEPIKKEAAKSYDPKTGIIEWEIEFNYNQKELSDVTLKDAWTPEGKLELVEDSLKFQEVSIDDNGNAHHEGEAVNLPDGAELVNGEDQFEVTGITTDKPYKVTYQTKVKDRVLDPFDVKNTAGFGSESSGSGTGVGQYYGSKSAGTVNYQNKTIDWTIEINHDEYPMEKINIKDTLGEGLYLKKDSLLITVDGKEYTGTYALLDESNNEWTQGDNPFTIKFPDEFKTDKKIVITYKTDYIADEVPDHKPTNNAAITWTPEGGDDSITREVDAGTELNENTKNNHWKNGSYNPDTKEITWTIYTNYRENQIDNLIVEDKPQGNQQIIDSSAEVKELIIEKGGKITEGDTVDGVATIDENNNTLKVDLGSTNKAYKIEYKTSIAGLSDIQKEYVNEAEIFDDATSLSKIDAKVGIAKAHTYGDKSGVQDGKQVHWAITVNPGQQQVENLKLEDTVSDNQDILSDTFKVYEASVDTNGNATKGKELDGNKYKLTHTEGESTFTVEWNDTVERAFIVEYSTLFFEKHNGEVTNSYKITGDNIIKDGKTDGDGSVTIKQLASGGGSGEAGYLVIEKVDTTFDKGNHKSPDLDDDNTPILEGVEFELNDADSDNQNVLKTGTTDSEGKIDFGRLLFGDYIIKEVVPDGYVSENELETITIDEKYDETDKTKYIHRVGNYKPVFMIELTKTNEDDPKEPLEGAEYTIYQDDQGNDKITKGETDEDGKIVFDLEDHNLKAGTYYVKETKAPAGFLLDDKFHRVIIGNEEKVPVKLDVTNKEIPGEAHIIKVDADADDKNKKLRGAHFTVQDENGNFVKDIGPTDGQGKINIGELQPGTYKLVEKTAPIGFKMSKDEIEFEIKRSKDSDPYKIDLEIENKVQTTSIELSKVDSVTGGSLEGAKFKLDYKSGDYKDSFKDDFGGPVQEKSNTNGKVVFENLKPGTYEITEIDAAEGYILDSTPIEVEVEYSDVDTNSKVTKTIENKPLAHIIVLKEDSETNRPLTGAKFNITDDNNNNAIVREGLTTDKDGELNITGLPAGDYTLIETEAPKGYTIDSNKERKFEVDQNRQDTKVIKFTNESDANGAAFKNNIIKGSVELTKVDGDNNNEPLEGVEFELKAISLENSNEKFLQEYNEKLDKEEFKTDANGKITVDDLRPGEYEFTETGPLNGYQPHWKDIMFDINLQNTKHEFVLDDIVNYKLIDIDVTKKWNDAQDADGERPDEITVELFRNNYSYKTVDVKASDNWTYTFTGLDAVDGSGEPYEYTVQEKPVDNYKTGEATGTMAEGFTLENTLLTSVEVEKEWEDDGNATGDRPTKVEIELFQDGTKIAKKEITSSNWKTTFADLPAYDSNGQRYNYTVKEEDISGYKQKSIEPTTNGYKITNVRTGEKDIKVTKDWKDEPNTVNRPGSITVKLYQKLHDEPDYPTTSLTDKVIEPDNDGKWEHVFKGLPEFDANGKAYEYKVEEVTVPGYTTEVKPTTNDGFEITNIRDGKTSVNVTKVWKDDENKDNDRPTEIEIELFRTDSKDIKSSVEKVDITSADDWKYTFANLDKYDNDGIPFTYEVVENNVDATEYDTEVEEVNDHNFVITNTRIGKTDVKVTKKWMDDHVNDRPDELTLQLFQNNDPIGNEQIVKPDGGKGGDWEYTFTNLEKYDQNGKEYTYTVKENDVDGYKQVSNEKNNDGDIVITNVRSEKTDIKVTKKWVDTDETKNRPSSITVELFQKENDQKAHRTVEIKPDNSNSYTWEYTFKNLEKFDKDGTAYNYIVKERPVLGYKSEIDGFKIKNIRHGTVEITGEKIWEDNSNVDGDRPEKITVKLLQNDIEISTQEVTAKDNWEYDFGGQPEFDEDGRSYEYTVKEVMEKADAERYESSVDGYDITNTRIGKTSVKGTKTWKDGNSKDRPTSITVLLLANGKKVDHTEVTSGNDWKYEFTNLKKYDDEGVEITYSVDEVDVAGYEKKIDEYDITNVRSEKTSIKVEKEWKDDSDATEKRPNHITVELFQNDQKKAIDATVIRPDEWEHTFTDLEKYDEEGEPYTYTVEELPIEGYKTTKKDTQDGVKLINIREGTTSVEVVKDWNDGNAQDNRPDEVIIELIRNNSNVKNEKVTTEDIKPNSGGIWNHTFDNLPAFDDEGVKYEYSVREKVVAGYQQEIIEKTSNGYIITNVATKDITINKEWLDDDSKNRPDSIEVDLYRSTGAGSKAEYVETYTVKSEDDWSLTIEDLPVFDQTGKAYTYEIEELRVDGYETTIDDFDITNLRVGKTEVEITKLWKDENETARPDDVKVNLLQNGKFYGEYDVTKDNHWKLNIKDLPKYDEKGKVYEYTIKEHDVSGYSSEIDEFEITNTRSEEKDIEIKKTWLDDDSKDRPDSIEVDLYRSITNGNKEHVETYTVKAKDGWSLEVKDLPAFDQDGKAYTYEIKEKSVDGYDTKINGFDITNLRVGTVDISGEKTWKDENEKDRPDEITVQVKNGDTVVEEKNIEADNDGKWTYTFTDLDKYDDRGKEIHYTIDEVEVDKYEKAIKGNDIVNTRTSTKDIEITKTWLDDESEDRPKLIDVELFRSVTNGNQEYVQTSTVKAEDNWVLEIKDLPAFDQDGKAYTYEIKEKSIDGYDTEIHGFDITNLRVGKTEVKGTKTWLDDDSKDRPKSIIVQLFANGKAVDSIKVSADSDWTYEFTNLDKYDDQGKAIVYSVNEESVAGYQKSIEDHNITNLRVGTKNIEITKLWKDEKKSDRPEAITVNLLQNGNFYEEYEVTKADGWKLLITDLPKYDELGKAYDYSVKEHDIPGYASDVNGFEITNTRADLKSIEITKTWLDNDAKDRPNSIEVDLYRSITNGNKEHVETYTVKAKDGWSFEVKDLPAFDQDGKAYTYEIKEKSIDGYDTEVHGFDITNLRVGKTEVTGTKTWLDDHSKERPESITVQLLANGKLVDSIKVSADSDWKYEFTNLDKYDDQGKEIVYSVDEEAVVGYKKSIKDYDLTNLRVGKTEVKGTKTWLDDDSKDRPKSITVQLLANGKEVDQTEVTAKNDWKYEFTDLDKYDDQGKEIVYSIDEEAVAGYQKSIKDYDLTNLRVGKTEVKGTKTWLDDDSKDRPKSITVQLLANGKEVDSVKVSTDSDWKYTFKDLDKYDDQGVKIEYTIDEEDVDGYKKSIEGTDITNLRVGTTEVEITKQWKDEQATDRPETIKVNLLQNGNFYEEYEVTKENDWKRTIKELPTYDDQGKAYEYTVKEHDVPGYAADVNGFEITNTRADSKSIEITKAWLDNDSKDRPNSIKVDLYRSITNGNKEHVETYTVKAKDGWSLEVKDLPAFDQDGKAYAYEIKEKSIDGYETKINGFDITNLRIGKTEVTGTKTWLDDDSKDRPKSITVQLLANGKKVDSVKASAKSDWKYEFKDLDKYDDQGKEIVYSVDEAAVAGYEKSIEDYDLTNLRVGTTDVSGVKTWQDDDSKDRPESIKVNLLQNGVVIKTAEITAADNWKYSFTGLEKYDEEGVAYEYTVKEHGVPGYQSEVDGFDITNIRSEKISVVMTKGWLDDNSEDRPDSITINLLQNGKVVDTVEVTEADRWTYEFKDLEAFDENGIAFEYTIEEETIEGYATIISGYDITNVRVGTTEVSGEKMWQGDNSEDRPESITVELLQNGNVVNSTEVTAKDNWKYSFTELEQYDKNGVAYEYTVQEQPVFGYDSVVDGFDIINKLMNGSVELTKYGDNEKVLEGAIFKLQDTDGNILLEGLTTDKHGKLVINDLNPGDYYLIETEAPKGYELDETPIAFTIEKGQEKPTKITAYNEKPKDPEQPEKPKDPEQPEKPKDSEQTEKPKDPEQTEEPTDPSTKPEDSRVSQDKSETAENQIPKTATQIYNMMLIGLILFIVGSVTLYYYRKQKRKLE